jgi:hypothetical protein
MVKVTIGDPEVEYDSFISVEDATTFLVGDVARAAGWALRNADAKARGLVSATRMLIGLPWCDGVPDLDAAPAVVQEVTAMLAADLLAKPRLFADATGNSNVKSVKAGSASVEFFSPVAGGAPIPRALWDMLLAADLVCLTDDLDEALTDGPFVSGISDGCRPLYGRYPWDWPVAEADYD